jgi:hypothetical protein
MYHGSEWATLGSNHMYALEILFIISASIILLGLVVLIPLIVNKRKD